MSLSKIESFISDKSGWIDKHIAKNDTINTQNKQIIERKSILVNGVSLPLYFGESNCITENYVRLLDFKYLKTTYIKFLQADFLKRFENISLSTSLSAKSVTVKDYKSRWGCCDGKNNICFNYKLMMLPERLQDYVIVHELCHTVHHDHSKKFWELVGAFLPDYKVCIKQIKKFSFLNNIY
jgi:hypothetical protein